MNDRKTLIPPILLICVGVGSLLSALGIAPEIDWVWTLGLALTGILTFAIWGVDKATIVVGPMFLVASLLSVLRQTGRLSINVEAPLLIILAGVLLLVARRPEIPVPRWLGKEA